MFAKLNEKFGQCECCKGIAEKLGIRPLWVGFMLIFLIIILIKKALCNSCFLMLLFCLHPVFDTFKAMKQGITPENSKPLLSFWVCFILFLILNTILPINVDDFPLAFLIKLAIVVILFHDNCKFSVKIMDGFLIPFLTKHEEGIEKFHKCCHECIGKKLACCCGCMKAIFHGGPAPCCPEKIEKVCEAPADKPKQE